VIALYGVQASTYALPLLTFPYLARVLGPSGWGSVLFAQVIGIVITCVVEYGFDISAWRETSIHRDDPDRLSELISGVLGAKAFLALACVTGAMLSRKFVQNVAPSPALFWSSTAWGVCQGINMLWFFQGLERMRLAGVLEVGGKILATLSIFILVHKPADGWKVMAAQCVGCVAVHAVTVVMAYREVGFCWPTQRSIGRALYLGESMFLFRAVQGVSGSVNRLVLGEVASVSVLGEYTGAEKITRVFQQGMWPVNQALYPMLTHQAHSSPTRAMNTVRLSIFFLGGLGLLFGLLVFVGAPLLVRVVLGGAFEQSVPVLRAFAVWIPLTALVTLMTFQLLLPNKLDYEFNVVNITSALVGIGAAVALAPKFSAVSIAWAAVIAQAYTVVAFLVILVRAGLNPFSDPHMVLGPKSVRPLTHES
jgi:PST family polysaccharide transporter